VSASVVVGIGHPSAGDDGVGIAVARSLAARGLEVREGADASILVELLGEGRRVIVVDAVVGGGAPGSVLCLAADSIPAGVAPLSTHGVGVADALELARVLHGEQATREVRIVGIVIELPILPGAGLSPPVAGAVERAAAVVATLTVPRPRDAGARPGTRRPSARNRRWPRPSPRRCRRDPS
jgi:hydrogenase maturation protease